MIFKHDLAMKVLNRQKTQTRRLVQEGEFAANQHGRLVPDDVWGDRIDTVYSAGGHIKWQVGRNYAIQPGRGKKAVGRFLLLSIRKKRLQEISCGGYMYRSDIQQEGCPFVNDPAQMGLDEIEWFIELWDSINTKNGTRWTDNPQVWVLEFEKAM